MILIQIKYAPPILEVVSENEPHKCLHLSQWFIPIGNYFDFMSQFDKNEWNINLFLVISCPKIYKHHNLDFCVLEICVFDFCGVLNYRHPLKFAAQNLDFCGKIAQNSKIHWKILNFFHKNDIFPIFFIFWKFHY